MQTSPDPDFKNPGYCSTSTPRPGHRGLGQVTDIAEFCFSVMEELNTTGSLDGMEGQNVDLFKSVANRLFSVFLEPTARHSALIFLRCKTRCCLCCSIKKKKKNLRRLHKEAAVIRNCDSNIYHVHSDMKTAGFSVCV